MVAAVLPVMVCWLTSFEAAGLLAVVVVGCSSSSLSRVRSQTRTDSLGWEAWVVCVRLLVQEGEEKPDLRAMDFWDVDDMAEVVVCVV